MASKCASFRVGKVQAFLRGRVWRLCYHDNGRRHRPRVGPDRNAARQLAAQVNAQLEVGAPAALSFQPISIPELRESWLGHHEEALRCSVRTVNRYRTATDHLLRCLETRPVRRASQFHVGHAAAFVCYLRALRVSPNGHANTAKRPLLDKGLRYVLECCRALFNFAAKRRHLSPYTENPFRALEIDRIPTQEARPIELITPDQLRAFLSASDEWQFPLFLTLMLTGLRPGELTHLLLPDDLDLTEGLLRVRNKPHLSWQIKMRNLKGHPPGAGAGRSPSDPSKRPNKRRRSPTPQGGCGGDWPGRSVQGRPGKGDGSARRGARTPAAGCGRRFRASWTTCSYSSCGRAGTSWRPCK
jgi:hypothetical protein